MLVDFKQEKFQTQKETWKRVELVDFSKLLEMMDTFRKHAKEPHMQLFNP